MKTNKILMSVFAIAFGLLFNSCNNNDDLNYSDVEGVYLGTLTTDISNKSSSSTISPIATAVVTIVGDQIEVHCYSEDFDTTIMLDIYEDDDMIIPCLTGDEFENMYGHMLGQDNHMNGNGSEWMQHLNNDHEEGDIHFGSFDMENHGFEYKFILEDGEYHFQGTKE